MSTQKNEHNPDTPKGQLYCQACNRDWLDEDITDPGYCPVCYNKALDRRRITPPTDTTGSDLLSLLQQIEMHCPCGARPESLDTHPHVSGCPVEQALVIVRSGPPEGWQKYAENLAFKLGQSHRTTGSGRESETAELAEAMERGRRAGVAASVIAEYSQHILSLERQRDAALARISELERKLKQYE